MQNGPQFIREAGETQAFWSISARLVSLLLHWRQFGVEINSKSHVSLSASRWVLKIANSPSAGRPLLPCHPGSLASFSVRRMKGRGLGPQPLLQPTWVWEQGPFPHRPMLIGDVQQCWCPPGQVCTGWCNVTQKYPSQPGTEQHCFLCKLSWGDSELGGRYWLLFPSWPSKAHCMCLPAAFCLPDTGRRLKMGKKQLVSFYSFYTSFFSEAIFQVWLHTCYSKGLNMLVILASLSCWVVRELWDGCAEEWQGLHHDVDTYSFLWVIISFESLTREGFLTKQCYCWYKTLCQQLMKT